MVWDKKENRVEFINRDLINVSSGSEGVIQIKFDESVYTLQDELRLPIKTFLETILNNIDNKQELLKRKEDIPNEK